MSRTHPTATPPYYYPYYKDEYPWFYISQDIEDGQHRLGWWWDGNEYFRGGYGGLVITYAAGTTAGQQSQGYLTFAYSAPSMGLGRARPQRHNLHP